MREGRRLRAIHADAPATAWMTGSLSLELESGAERFRVRDRRFGPALLDAEGVVYPARDGGVVAIADRTMAQFDDVHIAMAAP